jgi:hypothetical protein
LGGFKGGLIMTLSPVVKRWGALWGLLVLLEWVNTPGYAADPMTTGGKR